MKKIALYNPYLETKGGGERVCLALAESLKNDLGADVHLVTHSKIDLADLEKYFGIDLSGIKVEIVDFDKTILKIAHRLPLPGKIKNIFSDYQVLKTIRKSNYDVFINNCYQSNLPSPCANGVYMCMFPQRLNSAPKDASFIKKVYRPIAGFISRMALHPGTHNPIDTYRLITANSKYTQGYIKKLWNKDSEILYPQCDSMYDPALAKKDKIILNLGRFFADNGESHHKRQDALLATFAEMKDLHKDGWRLHFVGTVAEDVGALKYILKLMKQSQGLPVDFHFNCPFEQIRELYNAASVYWHATGYGSDVEKHPEKQEHFGISTVEAMSTGAIPIVINTAGQKEVVIPRQSGFLWDTLEELADQTRYVINHISENEAEKIRDNAKARAHEYDSDAFRVNVRDVFEKVVVD